MANIKFFTGENVPLEMHKVRIVQKLNLPTVEERKEAIEKAGFNTFLLQNKDVFMDMLTDSGVNAMSDRQQASMFIADDSYAGSATFTRLEDKVREIFGMKYFLPAHQGRACENILAEVFVKPGNVIPMNFHFTTPKAHITRLGGRVEELVIDEGLKITSDHPFKGNFDTDKLRKLIVEEGADNIPFIRIEAGTNLIGGQPFSLENAREVCAIAKEFCIPTVLDASLLQDNLYFIKTREESCKNMSIKEITEELSSLMDIIYFSARKLGFGRGGGICIRSTENFMKMRELIPLFEGFLTYGGMSVREMEAIVVGLDETMDMDIISQGPIFIKYMSDELQKHGIPVVTPAGGLGCHINAADFVPHIPQTQYPAGALAAALYIAGGIRGMERGTLSEQRNPDGTEQLSSMELVRLALPRRVFTLSQVKYAVDRIVWLYKNRDLIEGLRFVDEPETLRFFIGQLEPVSDWTKKLTKKFREDFGDSL
ncbi:tryptophanase [Miniphocaeibacter massiliensis]|uniref:tryptophanase n=1 Tax=Miniphocaeibacter massiliensis TaxID=2041841 RepID=UPI000C1C7B8A|nr:tryptophanase [Miniphocaeibacter massiliensis]